MSSTIFTSIVTGGTNSHATTVSEVNAFPTDFANPGVVGTIALNTGSGGTGSFAVNAQGTPAMAVDVVSGSGYIIATPAGQTAQLLRARMASTNVGYVISANSSGSTVYDWIYLSVDPTKANNPASDASDVTALYTSRSSSATADSGAPPTYGLLLAVVTVANGASSIANSAISDRRVGASLQSVSTATFFFDFIESGCVWTADSAGATLNASMTAGFIWISGNRLSVSSVSARTFTASRDTYVDLSDNGDGTAAFTYTTATNNAVSPALSTGAIRIAIIVSGSSSIAAATSINQGQVNALLPITSSNPYAVTDSLGNLIAPRDSTRSLLGQRQNITTTVITTGGGEQGIITVPVIVPANRRVKLTGYIPNLSDGGSAAIGTFLIRNNANTELNRAQLKWQGSDQHSATVIGYDVAPATGLNTYAFKGLAASSNLQYNVSATQPILITVELE